MMAQSTMASWRRSAPLITIWGRAGDDCPRGPMKAARAIRPVMRPFAPTEVVRSGWQRVRPPRRRGGEGVGRDDRGGALQHQASPRRQRRRLEHGWGASGHASWDGSAKIVDRSGRVIRVLRDEGFTLSAAQFSPDGRLVATAANYRLGEQGTGHVTLWDWERREVVRTIKTDGYWMDFDPSGSRIATAGPEGLAEIWDVDSGTRVAVLAGHSGGFNDIAFGPDGSRVATASSDGRFGCSTRTRALSA